MKNQLKIFIVVGLLGLMLPLLFGYLGPVGAAPTAIVKDHQFSKDITNETCGGCHNPNYLDPNHATYPGVHRRHLVSAFLDFATNNPSVDKGCGKCHEESVYGGGTGAGLGSGYEGDLSYAEDFEEDTTVAQSYGRSANKAVNADVCENCHGQFRGSLTGHGFGSTTTETVTTANQCVQTGRCHSSATDGGKAVDEHTSLYIDESYANSPTFCARCHGELAWYDTSETIGALQ